jgi:hypothetical protein
MKKVKWLDINKPNEYKNKIIKEIFSSGGHIYYKITSIISDGRRYGGWKEMEVSYYGDNEHIGYEMKEQKYYIFPDEEYCKENNIRIEILDKGDLFLEML